jgi:Zinc dependent phospholipase C
MSMKWDHDATVLQPMPRKPGVSWRRAGILVTALLCSAFPSRGYSVLSHEAIVDSAWDGSIKPLLLQRFPQSTPDDLLHAHAYAYAGCILQDMGYYPFGSRFFSDLVHYVRSGDFVVNLVRNSQDVDEYAFALGALAHYAADSEGHSIAVNRAVALQYPKLARKYGQSVTYADKPSAHLQVEFGFDVLQVSRGNYAPQAYHDFIGFEVAKPLLERTFRQTYSLELTDVFHDLDLALNTYRHTVSSLIPTITRAAWNANKEKLQAAKTGATKRAFVYNLSRASYRKTWGRDYKEPGIGVRLIGFLLRILPKIGPLRALNFRAPTTQTDLLFQSSFDRSLTMYRGFLGDQGNSALTLANRDFDTGEVTRPAEYPLADSAYGELAIRLAKKDPAAVDPQLRANVLAYFGDLNLPFATRKNASQWRDTVAAIGKLKAQ